MPTRRSAIKRLKTDDMKRRYNASIKSELKTEISKVRALALDNKKEEAEKSLPKVVSLIDKAAKKGVIHKNAANRRKSRLAAKISAKSS